MINKELIEMIYAAASMQRWNDHIRPFEFTELDKQAHKMIIAYIIGRIEELEKDNDINWELLIEVGIFEFLKRVVLTDIKPPIFYKLQSKHEEELNQVVINKTSDALIGLDDLKSKFKSYLYNSNKEFIEARILKAAHYLASSWEFRIIYELSRNIYGIEKTKTEIEYEIEEHYDLIGVQKIILGKKSHGFIDLCGQLRFQQRWAHTQRIPKTSVLGHMLVVAMLSYLCSIELKACAKRIYNNFFSALFHDLPEALTRDIVSPVRKSVVGMEDTLKNIEEDLIEERIEPLLPKSLHNEIRYFYFKEEDPFENKIIIDGVPKIKVSTEDINEHYNTNEHDPLDGNIIFYCDKLAAYIEAALSIKHGIESNSLLKGKENMRENYKKVNIGGFNFGQFFEYEYID